MIEGFSGEVTNLQLKRELQPLNEIEKNEIVEKAKIILIDKLLSE